MGRARAASETGYSSRIVARPIPRFGLDLLDDDAAEHIGPSVVRGNAHPLPRSRGGERIAIIEDREQIDARIAAERLRDGQPFPARRMDPASAAAPRKAPRAGRLRRGSDQRRTIVDERAVWFVGAIPFKHREFGRDAARCVRGCGTRARK